ncbi:MAG: hypothetical protein OEY28_00060 [Nitrospira sp.]|nr:hypothetical protein [Nitrospira sp.]
MILADSHDAWVGFFTTVAGGLLAGFIAVGINWLNTRSAQRGQRLDLQRWSTELVAKRRLGLVEECGASIMQFRYALSRTLYLLSSLSKCETDDKVRLPQDWFDTNREVRIAFLVAAERTRATFDMTLFHLRGSFGEAHVTQVEYLWNQLYLLRHTLDRLLGDDIEDHRERISQTRALLLNVVEHMEGSASKAKEAFPWIATLIDDENAMLCECVSEFIFKSRATHFDRIMNWLGDHLDPDSLASHVESAASKQKREKRS